MNAKEILSKIKAAFDAPMNTTPADVTAPGTTQVLKTKDGIELTVTLKDPTINAEPSVGDMVTIAGVPAPAGDYMLEDGTMITVDDTSAITAFQEPGETVTQDLSKVPAGPTVEERLAALEAEMMKMKQPSAMESAFSAKDGRAAQDRLEKSETAVRQLFELVEKIIDIPTADPKTLTGVKKDKFEKAQKREDKFQRILQGIKENKVQA